MIRFEQYLSEYMKKSSFTELDGKEKKRSIQSLDVKVSMENRVTNEPPIEELVEKLDITKCLNESHDSIILSKLLSILSLNYNIPIDNREVYYFSTEGELFVNCGVWPISEQVRIELKEVDASQYLHVKLKSIGLLHIARLMLTQNVVNNTEDPNDESEEEEEDNKTKKRCRRTKERRIGHVIQKVIEWRKLYSGTSDEARQHEKFSLEQAAKKVGISKKSLDDYLFQIRLGYRYGFNFNEHYNQKVGILRDYVRQQKKSSNKTQAKERKRRTKQEHVDE